MFYFFQLLYVSSLVNPSADQEVRGFQITHLARRIHPKKFFFFPIHIRNHVVLNAPHATVLHQLYEELNSLLCVLC